MLQQIVFLIVFSIFSMTAQSSTNLRADSYFISHSSGLIEFQPFDKHLLIHSDISIPIKYEDSTPFSIRQSPANSGSWNQPLALTDANYLYGKTGTWTGISLVEADFNGDNKTDLLARTSLTNAKAFIIYGSSGAGPERVDYLSGTEISSNTTIKDFDGDGKDEIAISANGQIHTVYDVTGSSGNLVLTKNTTIDYRQFNLGGYLGYKPKTSSLVVPNRLSTSVNYTNGSLNIGLSAYLPVSEHSTPQLSFTNTNSSSLGLLGTGWDIQGLSEISPCVSFDVENKSTYCKDGQELELIHVEPYGNGHFDVVKTYKYKNAAVGQVSEFKFSSLYETFTEYMGDGNGVMYGGRSSGAAKGNHYKISEIFKKGVEGNAKFYYSDDGKLSNIRYGDRINVDFEYSNKIAISKNRHYLDVGDGSRSKAWTSPENKSIVTKLTINKADEKIGDYTFGYQTEGSIRLDNIQYCASLQINGNSVEQCEPAYTVESEALVDFEEQTYISTLTEDEFQFGTFYSKENTWRIGGSGLPWVKFSKSVGRNTFRVNDIDLTNGRVYTQAEVDFKIDLEGSVNDVLHMLPGNDEIKSLNMMYYKNYLTPSFFAMSFREVGVGCSTSSRSNINCDDVVAPVKIGLVKTDREDADFNLSSDFGSFEGLNQYDNGIYPIHTDINNDGVAEIVNIYSDYYNNYRHLSISVGGRLGQGGAWKRVMRWKSTWQRNVNHNALDLEVKITGLSDFDGDGNTDIIINVYGTETKGLVHDYYYHAEIDSVTYDVSVSKLHFSDDAYIDLIFSDPLWMDVNGDSITDMVFVSDSGTTTYITKHIKAIFDKDESDFYGDDIAQQSELEFQAPVVQITHTNPTFSDDGIVKSNAISYDFNHDGMSDLLVLDAAGNRAKVLISNGTGFDFDGELSARLNIRARNINQIKVNDYDRDSHQELIERLSNGQIRIIDINNNVGRVISVNYGDQTIVEAEYDVSGTVQVPTTNILPPNNRAELFNNKLSNLKVNVGSKGWVKKSYKYSDIAALRTFHKQGFKTIVETISASPSVQRNSSGLQFSNVTEMTYSDTLSSGERFVAIDKVNTKVFSNTTEVSGQNFSFDSYESIPATQEITGAVVGVSPATSFKYYINYNSNEKSYIARRDASGSLQVPLVIETKKAPDSMGRLEKVINISAENPTYQKFEYGYSDPWGDYPAFLTKLIKRSSSTPEVACADTDTIAQCSESETVIEPYERLDHARTGAFPGKVTEFNNTAALKSTTTFDYDTEDGYLNKITKKDVSSLAERVQILGAPESGQPSSIKQGSLAKTTYTYNPYGQVLTQVEPNGTSITNTYDGLGRQTSSISNIGANTTTSYNSCSTMSCPAGGYMYTETLAESGEKTRTYYDLNGAEVGSGRTNSDGVWLYTFNKYDIKGRVVKAITNAQSFSSTVGKEFKYRTDNLIAEMKEPKGTVDNGVSEKITTFAYDFKNKTELSDQILATELDIGYSLLVKQTTIKEKHIALTVDGLTVPAKENTKIVWSSAATDRLLGHDLDLASHTGTLYYYDVWGKNSKTKVIGKHGGVSGALATGVTTQTYVSQYDKAGNLVFSDRPGRDPITHTYNAFGELTKTIAADESFISMTYDDLGRIKTKSYSGITSANIDAKTYTWNYDVTKGLLSTIQDTTTESSPVDVESFTYKAKSPLVDKHSKTINGNLYSKTYTYDTYGRIEDEIFNGGYGFKHGYNNGQLSSIKDLAGSSIWSLDTIDRQGRPTLKTYFNDLKYHQAFETYSNQLTSRYLKKGTDVLDGEELFFDPLDNLVFKAASVGAVNADNLRMSYDDKNRISSVTDNNIFKTQQRNFGFDDFGNFLHKDSTDGKYSYSTYNGGYNSWISGYKLSGSAANESISYSASTTTDEGAGHITELAGFTLGYNEMGQPTSISNNSGYNTRFNYGSNDELVSVSYSDGRTIALWGDMQHVTLHSGEVAEESYYRYRKNAAIILKGGVGSQYNGSYVVHIDHLGSVRSVWDSTGGWVGNQTFDAYGKRVSDANAAGMLTITDAGYTGQLMIEGTSFIHMNARLYDYGSGVFTSVDPLFADMQRAGGLNAYGYVYGNPFSFVDPSGKAGQEIDLGTIQVIGTPYDPSQLLVSQLEIDAAQTLSNRATREFISGSIGNFDATISAAAAGVLSYTHNASSLKNSGQYMKGGNVYNDSYRAKTNAVRKAKSARDAIAGYSGSLKYLNGVGTPLLGAGLAFETYRFGVGDISGGEYSYSAIATGATYFSGRVHPGLGLTVGLGSYGAKKTYEGVEWYANKLAEASAIFQRRLMFNINMNMHP